ncbi:caspase family protein [Streptomyces sp. DH1]|uniref:caspase family protein n=1 Tax=Streptomyces sp. DH1 TaxID=2857012 RepID=UPI001E5D8F6F|nr:caspase family protein [Streptomyces sp. DH1]
MTRSSVAGAFGTGTPNGPATDGLNRYVFAFGTGTFTADPLLEDLPGVTEDLRRVTDLFSSLGYVEVLPEFAAAPDAQQVRAGLEDWLKADERCKEDVLVVYYAGHGLRDDRYHRLTCRNSRRNRVSTTLASRELADLLADTQVGHVLLLLDTCYAELGAAEIANVTGQLVDYRPPGADGLWLVASARSRGLAYDHAFVAALEAAVHAGTAGMRQRYLDIPTVIDQVNDHFREHRPDQCASYHAVSGRAVPPFLPNPKYRPDLPDETMDVESQREWTAHFGPRGRGVEYASEPGDWFTGRRQALATLAGWLHDPVHDARARVVTGDPGSGKSAVLGRLLTLARPDHPETPAHLLPPPGSITVSVHAHGTTLERLTARLADALNVEADTPSQLLVRLAEYEGPLRTVLVDALEEAGTGVGGREPQRIARELLRPMSVLHNLRLLIGTRRTMIPELGRAVEVIDLDSDAYTGRDDIERYVRRTLAGMPGRMTAADREAVSAAVARRAGCSFLVARMTVRALLCEDLTLDLSRPGWEKELPSEVGQAFDAYLARYGEYEERVRRLLRPLAYGEGSGLPWDSLWAPLAAALSGEKCTNDDIDWLWRQAGAYVVEVPSGEGRSVFRLYHEAMAEHLRDPRRSSEDQRRMTAELIASVPLRTDGDGPDWERAHPYIHAHLAGHAAASGDLECLLQDPWFLVNAEPDGLLAAMDDLQGGEAQRVSTMYRTSAHLYRDLCVHERAQVLAVDSARYRLAEHRRRLGRRLEWAPRWATGSQTSSLFRGELSSESGTPLVTAELKGTPVVLSAQRGGPVQIWDPAQQSCMAVLEGHTRTVAAMDCIEVEGVTLVVTASDDGTVRVWDLARTTELRRFVLQSETEVAQKAEQREMDTVVAGLACIRSRGEVLIVGCAPNGSAWARELMSGEVRRTLPGISTAGHYRLAVVRPKTHGAATVLVGSPSGPLRRWNLETGAWDRLHESEGCRGVASGTQDSRELVTLGYRKGELQFRDPATDTVVSSCRVGQGWITAIAFTELDGRAVMVVGYGDGSMELRERPSGRLLARLNGHTDWVHSIVITRVDGRPAAASSGSGGSVRVWSLEVQAEALETSAHSSQVQAVVCTVLDGSAVAVSASHDHTARIWDVASGRVLQRLEGHTDWVERVACVTISGAPIAVTSSNDGTVRTWTLADGLETRRAEVEYSKLQLLACGSIEGRSVALLAHNDFGKTQTAIWNLENLWISGAFDIGAHMAVGAWAVMDGQPVVVIAEHEPLEGNGRRVGIWNLADGMWMGDLHGLADQVNALACGTDGHGPVVLAATAHNGAQVWDLRTRKLRCRLGDGWVSDADIGQLDGVPVAVIAHRHAVSVWDLASGTLLHEMYMPVDPGAVAFAPSGELVVGAGYEVIVLER